MAGLQRAVEKLKSFFIADKPKKMAVVIPITEAKSAHRMGAIGNQTGSVKGSCGYLPGIES